MGNASSAVGSISARLRGVAALGAFDCSRSVGFFGSTRAATTQRDCKCDKPREVPQHESLPKRLDIGESDSIPTDESSATSPTIDVPPLTLAVPPGLEDPQPMLELPPVTPTLPSMGVNRQ